MLAVVFDENRAAEPAGASRDEWLTQLAHGSRVVMHRDPDLGARVAWRCGTDQPLDESSAFAIDVWVQGLRDLESRILEHGSPAAVCTPFKTTVRGGRYGRYTGTAIDDPRGVGDHAEGPHPAPMQQVRPLSCPQRYVTSRALLMGGTNSA